MRDYLLPRLSAGALCLLLAACAEQSILPPGADVGPQPTIKAPVRRAIPTVDIAPAKGWPPGGAPGAAAGLAVKAFASGLDHPRWLLVLPNGDVLVAETNAPERPEDKKGIRGFVMGKVMAKAGAAVPSANRITLLRDADGDGVAETKSVFLKGLNSPFGMALVGDMLYVANTDGIVRFPYREGMLEITAGAQPQAPAGFRVTAFARGLDHPRWLYVLLNGDVLVAESNQPAPPPEQADKGLRAWVMKQVMKRAGAGVASADRITLLRDADGDGVAETRSVLLQGLRSPFGMALVGSELYVANADALVRVPYAAGQTRIDAPPVQLTELPAGRNHHWTKGLVAAADGSRLYVSVGSNSNAGEHGLAEEEGRAAVWEVDRASGRKRLYASGLRNPVSLAFEPQTRALWVVVNERDELGSDLVPDYLTSVKDGAFYGWPWSYWGAHVDGRVQPPRPDKVAQAIAPDYALGNHVAPLGLAFADGRLPAPFAYGAFVGEHGSWNRQPRAGYKVVFVPFANGRPSGAPIDVLTGFLSPDGKAYGRPVGVALDKAGALLVADDVGNTVWRVAPAR
jgi:glucose/arabinose dehydrogenase